jgi:hypothetical protein
MQRGVATLRDLPVQGVGLLLPSGLEPGTALLLQFPGPRRGATYTQLARVAHAGPHLSGNWLVGCRLTPGPQPPGLGPTPAAVHRPVGAGLVAPTAENHGGLPPAGGRNCAAVTPIET